MQMNGVALPTSCSISNADARTDLPVPNGVGVTSEPDCS